jgi:hypothetical protein
MNTMDFFVLCTAATPRFQRRNGFQLGTRNDHLVESNPRASVLSFSAIDGRELYSLQFSVNQNKQDSRSLEDQQQRTIS